MGARRTMLSLAMCALAHVPTYGSGVENCHTPPHHHDTSQVVYLAGSGGLEIHCTLDSCPFSFDELLDVDAVFRDEVDQSTYSLFIGCGGCVSTADPIVIPPVALNGYQQAVVEPFTQTRYSSVFPLEDRKYNTSGIHPSVCSEGHFTIRLVDHMNRTGAHKGPIFWGAVIGLGESFTVVELLSFPLYVLRNHGSTWNNVAWTAPLCLFIFGPLLIVAWRFVAKKLFGCKPLSSQLFFVKEIWPTFRFSQSPRIVLYELAIVGFVAFALECFIHLQIAAQGTSATDYGYWAGLFVILFSNGFPLWQVLTCWHAIEYNRFTGGATLVVVTTAAPPNEYKTATSRLWTAWTYYKHWYWSMSGNPRWAPFEFLTGISYFFLFGSGCYIGPASICLAALFRMRELCAKPRLKATVCLTIGVAPRRDGEENALSVGQTERPRIPSLLLPLSTEI